MRKAQDIMYLLSLMLYIAIHISLQTVSIPLKQQSPWQAPHNVALVGCKLGSVIHSQWNLCHLRCETARGRKLVVPICEFASACH